VPEQRLGRDTLGGTNRQGDDLGIGIWSGFGQRNFKRIGVGCGYKAEVNSSAVSGKPQLTSAICKSRQEYIESSSGLDASFLICERFKDYPRCSHQGYSS